MASDHWSASQVWNGIAFLVLFAYINITSTQLSILERLIYRKAETKIHYKKNEPVSMAFKATEYTKKLSVLHPLWDTFGLYLVWGVAFRIMHGLLEFASPSVLRYNSVEDY